MNLGKGNSARNLGLAYAFLSVGTMVGPGLLSLFGIMSYGFLGVMMIVCSIFFFLIPSFYC